VDGGLAVLASPAAAVTEMSHARALKLLPCPQPLLDHLATFGLGQGMIAAGTYPKIANAGETVASATMGTTIIASTAMADVLAYTITKTVNDHVDRVRRFHPSATTGRRGGFGERAVASYPSISSTVTVTSGKARHDARSPRRSTRSSV
jgi:TRAP-type uncharacterized transport system substrate-binding protein